MWKLLAILALLGPAPDAETFTVTGTVKMKPPFHKAKPNKALQSDPKCAEMCKEVPLHEDLVVNEAGHVKWSFVYIKKGLEGKAFKAPEEPLLLDQVGCTYTPRVFGIRVGQPLDIRNSDPMLHNVNCTAFNNKQFNYAQVQGQVNREVFKQPEIGMPMGCNIHTWMKVRAHVMEHPFFATTDAAGKFAIKGLPPGKYTLAAWHEKFKTVEQEIEVKADRTVEFTLTDKHEP